MRKTEIPSPGGYMIPLDADIRGGEKLACIISHGFASSRKSTTAQMMMAHCRSMGMASVAFDWVCHGESRAHYSRLTVDACLDDLVAVERWISLQLPDAEIVYFGSSFGAYLDICHICSGRSLGRRAFLRSAAVDMDVSFGVKTPEVMAGLARDGYYKYDPGFGDGLKLCESFFDSLAARSAFNADLPGEARLFMVHGTCDEEVSPGSARRYAYEKGVPLVLVPGAGHGIETPEGLRDIKAFTRAFYLAPQEEI